MLIELKFVFIALTIITVFSLVFVQIIRPIPMHRKWNWRNPHEKLMVLTYIFFALVFISKAYNWSFIL